MRKFACPFCNFTKNYYGDESKYKKRVTGLTCPRCGKKVTDDDIRRIKGKGPKPLGERRKRVKKRDIVKETPKAVVHPYVEQFEWRTRDSPPPGEPRRVSWRPKPLQPERTLEEAVVEAFLSDPRRRKK